MLWLPPGEIVMGSDVLRLNGLAIAIEEIIRFSFPLFEIDIERCVFAPIGTLPKAIFVVLTFK